MNAAISKQAVDAAGMVGVQFVVGRALLPGGVQRAWWPAAKAILIGGLVPVIGLARNPERGIGFGPPPVTAGPGQTPRRTQTKDRARIALGS